MTTPNPNLEKAADTALAKNDFRKIVDACHNKLMELKFFENQKISIDDYISGYDNYKSDRCFIICEDFVTQLMGENKLETRESISIKNLEKNLLEFLKQNLGIEVPELENHFKEKAAKTASEVHNTALLCISEINQTSLV